MITLRYIVQIALCLAAACYFWIVANQDGDGQWSRYESRRASSAVAFVAAAIVLTWRGMRHHKD